MIEKTFAYVKPDAVVGGHLGHVLTRVEGEGFRVERMALYTFSGEDVDQLYAEHLDRPWYPELRTFTTSGPVVLLVLVREDAVARWRWVLGATDPREAWWVASCGHRIADTQVIGEDIYTPGYVTHGHHVRCAKCYCTVSVNHASLRALYGDKGGVIYRNVAHGSATVEDAERELRLAEAWFLRAGAWTMAAPATGSEA